MDKRIPRDVIPFCLPPRSIGLLFNNPGERGCIFDPTRILLMNNLLKITTLTVCLTVTCSISKAQSIQSISGRVVNSEGEGLFGNAMIVSPLDSSLVTGAAFFDGKFKLSNLNAQSVLLKFASLEFKDAYIWIEYTGLSHVDLGDILVEDDEKMLDELVIEAKSPLIIEKPGGSIEVNVANTNLATSTSVDEILGKSPSIVYNADGEIGVFGKGNAMLFINGIRVANERLSTLSPSNIEKIEILSNPGPRFDAEGNAVINIITKTRMDEGSRATFKNYVSHTDFAGVENRSDVIYSYSKGKLSVNSNYGLTIGNDRMILKTTRTRNETGSFFNSDLETDWEYDYDNFSNYGLGVQYDFNKNSYFSLQYTGAYEDLGGGQFSNNMITDEEIGVYTSELIWDELSIKNTLNANYYLDTDTVGSNLFIGSQYASYRHDFDNDINELNTINGVESTSFINNLGENNIEIFSVQLDYTKVFNKKHALEWGTKFGYVNINSNTTFFDIDESGRATRNERLSSSFEYDEMIPAGYVNFKGSLNEQINYGLGLRTEWTNYTLSTSVEGGKVIDDNFINLFPNASLTIKLQEGFNAYITYSSRINRASYRTLNPFVIYQDAFTSIQGNPSLQPSKVHSIEVGATREGWSIKTGYNYTIDPIDGGAFQSEDNPREYILQRTNLDRGHGYFASLSKNINLKGWRSINMATISYDHLIDNSGIFGVNNNEPYYYLYSQNSFDVEGWITLYLTGWYLSDKRDGINFEKNYSSVNIGLEKKLLNNTITCNLDFNDIFHSVRAAGEYKLGTTDIIYGRTFNTNYIRFLVSYQFGNLKKSKYQNKDVGESENRRAR